VYHQGTLQKGNRFVLGKQMELTSRREEILQGWEIEPVATWHMIQDNIARITLANGRQVVLKQLGLHSEDSIRRLQFEYDVLQHVDQLGLSVALPLLSTKGVPYVIDSDQIYRLSNWLPNQPAEVRTGEERVRLYQNYGAAIGRFHRALASYQDDEILNRTWQTGLQKRVLSEAVPVILAHLEPSQLQSFETLLAEIEPMMMATYADLPLQPIIWDCHPGNVAVDGFEVSGFIDCDHISLAPRIFDLADFLVHLIKWDVGDEQKEAIWLAHYQQLIVGYESVTLLSRHERSALFYAMVGIPLIFMDFFLQGGLPELTKVELDTFVWLVRHRRVILAQLEAK
jgi:Ser/Thr protein kinase RdoA (MazF antagonist)